MDLQELDNRLNKVEKSQKRVIMTCLVAFLLILAIIMVKEYFGKDADRISALEAVIKEQVDSLISNDSRWAKLDKQLQDKNRHDSAIYLPVIAKVNAIPAMINTIKHRYDVQRTTITALSNDQQLQLFTTWLSQTDSL